MRLLAALTLLVPATAFANPDALRTSIAEPSPPAQSVRVDPRTPSETGQLRSARVAAPDPVPSTTARRRPASTTSRRRTPSTPPPRR